MGSASAAKKRAPRKAKGRASPERPGRMVFTVGTFDDDDGGRRLAAPATAAGADAGAAPSKTLLRRQPLFTMGSNSEVSDMDGASSDGAGLEKRATTTTAHSPSQLHVCKATTSLSQLCESRHSPGHSREPSEPAAAAQADAAAGAPQAAARAGPPREGQVRPRKRPSARRLHGKKTPLLRSRARAGASTTAAPRVAAAAAAAAAAAVAGPDGAGSNGPGDSSYVDYSGSDDDDEDEDEDGGGDDDDDNSSGAEVGPHSPTATLDGAGQADDSATTTSIDSRHGGDENENLDESGGPRQAEAAAGSQGPVAESQAAVAESQAAGSQAVESQVLPPQEEAEPEPPAQPAPQAHSHNHSHHHHHHALGAYGSIAAKRNMESQRQRSMLEKEEEDMAAASALLTGVPCGPNRPAGMAPHVFLTPDTHAYRVQVHRTERTYAHVRAMAHPLLMSIARSARLREQRQAAAPLRDRPRLAARGRPAIGGGGSSSSDWWAALLPPPPPGLSAGDYHHHHHHYHYHHHHARAAQRGPHGAAVPRWAQPPDAARSAVYAPDAAAGDAACSHVRELRSRAADLGLIRHAQPAAAAAAAAAAPAVRAHAPAAATARETWRGRCIPGLANVKTFASAAAPVVVMPPTPDADAAAPGDAHTPRANRLAPPYRRHGTVYGRAHAAAAAAALGAAGSVGSPGPSPGGASLRRYDSIPAPRAKTASIHEPDPRRTSYFDRLSIDDDSRLRAPAAPAAHQSPVGLFRRVVSGLTGGTLGSSQ